VDWKNKKVLVTGAGGFIGSHLTERLVALGAETRALVRYNSASSHGWLDNSSVKDSIEIISGDICDGPNVRSALRGIDIVFHLAALISVTYSYENPDAFVKTNVEGTVNVFQGALDAGVGLVIHTSSSEVYGSARYTPIDEAHPLQGQSPYAASKIGADKMAESFHRSMELPVAVIRPFNTYGPRQSARAVIPAIITQALTQPTVRLGSLTPIRDFNYVSDTVEGYIRMAESPRAIGEVINLGSGREISIGDLADTILKLVGKEATVEHEGQRMRPKDSEVDRLLADNSKAREIIGWEPQYTLKQGLTEVINWIENNLDHFQPGTYVT
jgi:dTDP-glucose 4,6-dehydratase